MEYIDCVYYINLEHRTERREEFLNEMKLLGVPESKIVRIDGVYTKGAGVIGCQYSHIKALTAFIESGHKNCIIFEDDFKINLDINYAKYLVRKLFEKNIQFDVVMLGGSIHKAETTDILSMSKAHKVLTTSGYIITKEFAPVLKELWVQHLPLIEEEYKKSGNILSEYCLDVVWTQIQPQNRWYIFNPKIGKQRESYSDIENKVTAYID
jgi:GR25 family glycosyltransferase involved in LPS biosynthesis